MENFSEAFYKPDGLYEAGMLDHIFRGMIKTHTQSEDLHVNEEMTNKMFMDSKFGFGLDLVAQVIQQGRDHGLPGYNLYRAICNLTRADDFNGLRREIAPPVIERLRRTYAHVDDVDLFTGW